MRVLSKAANKDRRISFSCTPKSPAVQAKSVPFNILLNRGFSRFSRRMKRLDSKRVSMLPERPNQEVKRAAGKAAESCRFGDPYGRPRAIVAMPAATDIDRSVGNRAPASENSSMPRARVPPCPDLRAAAQATPRDERRSYRLPVSPSAWGLVSCARVSLKLRGCSHSGSGIANGPISVLHPTQHTGTCGNFSTAI